MTEVRSHTHDLIDVHADNGALNRVCTRLGCVYVEFGKPERRIRIENEPESIYETVIGHETTARGDVPIVGLDDKWAAQARGEAGPFAGPFDEMATIRSTHEARTVYPSFYNAVHRAWDRRFPSGESFMYACRAPAGPYEPDQHACFDFAGMLRVELYAAGIMLSNDGPTPHIDERSLREALTTIEWYRYFGRKSRDTSPNMAGIPPLNIDEPWTDALAEDLAKFYNRAARLEAHPMMVLHDPNEPYDELEQLVSAANVAFGALLVEGKSRSVMVPFGQAIARAQNFVIRHNLRQLRLNEQRAKPWTTEAEQRQAIANAEYDRASFNGDDADEPDLIDDTKAIGSTLWRYVRRLFTGRKAF
jgi:hypothetical protein